MLTLNDLDQFEKRLKSGELEAQFRCAPEGIRLEILEMLEKIMDVADLADEAATRLIFRSQAPGGSEQ